MTPATPAPEATPPPAASALDAAAAAAMSVVPNDLPLARIPADLVRSSFDDSDRVNRDLIPDYHPVPDRGPITSSSFDDSDRADYHPVP